MKNIICASAAIISLIFSAAQAQLDLESVTIKTEKLADGIYMLQGTGGNIGLSIGDDGVFMVDDQFAPLTGRILAAIGELSDQPVEFVLNTHYHGDHTGGNEAIAGEGAHIIAHENVRHRLADGAAPEGALPVLTFNDRTTFHWNDQTIEIRHVANAHTDGDAAVYFTSHNIIHTGDLFFSGMFPYIDLDAGGSVSGVIDALQEIADTANQETKIIPGHGPVSTRGDILTTITMLKEVQNLLRPFIVSGASEDEVVAADPLQDLNKDWAWGFITGERMTRIAYKSEKADAE